MPIFYIGIYFYHVTWSRQHLLHQVRSCVPCLKFLPSLITQIYFLPSQLHNFGDWSYASRFISTLVSLGSVRQQCWCHHHNHCHHQHHSGHTAALWTMHLLTFVACVTADKLVGLITCKQGSIHWFHTWWTCEASHKPVINAFHMVCMHAREVAYRITNHEFDHADHTLSVLLAAIICASGKMLNQSNPFRNFDLLLFSQLCSRSAHIWGRIVDRHGLLVRWWWTQLLGGRRIPCAITTSQERYVISCRAFQAVPHFLSSSQTDKGTAQHLPPRRHIYLSGWQATNASVICYCCFISKAKLHEN